MSNHRPSNDPGWNYADVWEAVAGAVPGGAGAAPWGSRRLWREFDERADGVAASLLAAGLGRQGKVAQYMRNGPEYLESLFAAFKAGHVPVNTNYRYGRRRASLPVGQQRRSGGGVRRRVHRGVRAAAADRCRRAAVAARRRQRPMTRSGRRRTKRRPPSSRPGGRSHRGAAPVTICTCCTPAARPACPRV